MKRLFFALWPDTQTRHQCTAIQTLLPENAYKLTTAQNMHVTLVFLGNVNAETELALTQAVANIAMPRLSIQFDYLSHWQKAEVLCLRCTTFDPRLAALVAQLSGIAQQLGINLDPRPYTPHITLARKAKQPVAISFSPINWSASEFCLVESCSTAEGVQYRVLNTF